MDEFELKKKLRSGEISSVSLSILNYPKCPKCNSDNVKLIENYCIDYIRRPTSAPSCNDCGYRGINAFESIHWGCAMINDKVCFTAEDGLKAIELCKNES